MDSNGPNGITDNRFYLNGVDALTGGPLRDAQSVDQVAELAKAGSTTRHVVIAKELKALSRLNLPPTTAWMSTT